MNLHTERYITQATQWPQQNRHILAQFDAETVVVYQAYRSAIGHFAAQHGYFGNGFSYDRMSWIKPNFLWMMYRSGWGIKPDQEVTLAIRLRRSAFDAILAEAVTSSYKASGFASETEWKAALATSEVRLQWDPNHYPSGGKHERRAIQMGLRGETLAKFGRKWILEIEDISDFVAAQRLYAVPPYTELVTPREEVYPVAEPTIAKRIGLLRSDDGT